MPWCPNCKNEYVEGITVCADCGSALVDSLEETEAQSGDEAAAYDFELPEEGEFALPEDVPNEVRLGRQAGSGRQSVYEDSEKKAEEFKSGAYTLLIVGVLGLLAMALLLSGALPVRLNPATQWMTVLVMGALFVLFIVMGVLSLRSSRRLAQKAVSEASLKEELSRYCEENLDAGKIDAAAGVWETEEEELRYFKRTEQMKLMILERFPDTDDGYLDYFVDEIYPRVFEHDRKE